MDLKQYVTNAACIIVFMLFGSAQVYAGAIPSNGAFTTAIASCLAA